MHWIVASQENGMASTAYEDVLQEVQRLTSDEQLRLLEELAALVRHRLMSSDQQHSILELRGLGRELWRQIDTTAYLNQERDSWDG